MSLLPLLLLACTGSGSPAASTPPPSPPAPVVVEVVSPASFDRKEEAVGIVSTLDSVELRPETSGLVNAVYFHDGQAVKKGMVLVRLRDMDAIAGLNDAKARARLASLALERIRSVFTHGDASQAEVDKAAAEDELAKAAVQRAEEALRKTTIVAPFDGVVGKREVSVGQAVDPSRVITRLEALDRLAVDVSLPEDAAARVQEGQEAEVHVDALDTWVAGSVSYVAPRLRDDSRTLDVRVALPPSESRFRPGMTAQVRIVTAKVAGALLVPSQAIVPGAAGASVWTVGPENAATLHAVTLGQRTSERVEVATGLTAGDAVIVEGLARLRPGAKVQVVDKPTAQDAADSPAAEKPAAP